MQDFEPFLENPATSALIRSGQFAELCQTTKETLRHYRAIGLLEPVAVGENGYALYSPLQLSDFLLVSALKNAGCSLDEVRSYLTDPAAGKLRPVIEERIAAIEEQRRALLHQRRFLENTLARARALSSWSDAESPCRLQRCPEAWFLDTDISDLFLSSDAIAPGGELELVRRLMEQWNLCQRRGLGGELQGCYRVGLQALMDGAPEHDFHLCMAVPSRPKGRKASRRETACGKTAGIAAPTCSDSSAPAYVAKPEGEYFQWLRRTSIGEMLQDDAPIFSAYHEFMDELRKHRLHPVGDLFEQELSLYAGNFAETTYTELSMRVEPM